jgi:hypothetical protein
MLPLLFSYHLVIPSDNVTLPAMSVKRSFDGQRPPTQQRQDHRREILIVDQEAPVGEYQFG